MRIFVLHYAKLTERKRYMLTQFAKQGIPNYEFIELFDKDKFTPIEASYFSNSINRAVASLFLKHIHACRLILERNLDYALILEDDATLCDNFMKTLNDYISQLPSDWDKMYIGDGCHLHIPAEMQKEGQNVYLKTLYPTSWGGNGGSRCTEAILISKKGAKTIVNHFDATCSNIPVPVDHWFNDVYRKYNCNIYWAEPTIATQMPENGKCIFPTSLEYA